MVAYRVGRRSLIGRSLIELVAYRVGRLIQYGYVAYRVDRLILKYLSNLGLATLQSLSLIGFVAFYTLGCVD